MEYETLYCLKGHTYANKWVSPSDTYEVRARHAGVLVLIGKASRTPPDNVVPFPTPVKATETPQPAPPASASEFSDPSPADDEADEREDLRAEYKRLLGKAAAGRMSNERLREEIEKAKGE